MHKMLPSKVTFVVHGNVYETLESTLQRYPLTLLASKTKRGVNLADCEDKISVDCGIAIFDAILFYYQSYGILRRPPEIPMDEFVQNCRQFEIDEAAIKNMQELEGFLYLEEVACISMKCKLQENVWRFLAYPESSTAASLFAVLSCIMIAASTCLACIETLPSFKQMNAVPFLGNPLLLTELAMNLFFGVEYFFKLIASPSKLEFLKSYTNGIDLLAVLPYFIALAVDVERISDWKYLRLLRTVRILRLLRLTKQSKTLDMAVRIIATCGGDVLTMALTLFLSCLFCGSLEYYAELGDPNSDFVSLPQSIWWAAQTVIPVGYGDIIPRSTLGRIVGGMVVALSALTFTLPLLFLGGKFLKYYSKNFGIVIQTDSKKRN